MEMAENFRFDNNLACRASRKTAAMKSAASHSAEDDIAALRAENKESGSREIIGRRAEEEYKCLRGYQFICKSAIDCAKYYRHILTDMGTINHSALYVNC